MSDDKTPYSTLDDPRVVHLSERLARVNDSWLRFDGGPNGVATHGLIALLVHWTAQHAPNGSRKAFSNSVIARAVDWNGDPDAPFDALVESGFVDNDRQLVGHAEMLRGLSNFLGWCFEESPPNMGLDNFR